MISKEKEMLERLKPERHIPTMMALATIRFIKEECKKNASCDNCRFYKNEDYYRLSCYFNSDYAPIEWNEYDLTERIYK